MTYDIFKAIVTAIRNKVNPNLHIGIRRRDDGLFSALVGGISISSTKGSEYLCVKWGDGHMSRVKALDMLQTNT